VGGRLQIEKNTSYTNKENALLQFYSPRAVDMHDTRGGHIGASFGASFELLLLA
jgi:hypothetical protein